jgi:hypothetical protein
MLHRLRYGLVPFAGLLLVVLVTGCGGSKGSATRATVSVAARSADPSTNDLISDNAVPAPGGAVHGRGVVARVGNQVITKTAFDDRMRIEAHQQSPKNPILLVPPAYNSCIAQLDAFLSGLGSSGTPPHGSRSQLKARCAKLYKYFQPKILKELISGEWVIVGAEEQGIKISDDELRQNTRSKFGLNVKSSGPSGSSFAASLSSIGENVPDLLWNTKVDVLATKLRERADAMAGAVTPAVAASYYAAHKAAFTTPEERDIGVIRARSLITARRVKAALESGTSFEALAKRLRPQPLFLSSGAPGLVKGLKRKVLLQNALDAAIFAARAHVISGPVRLNLFPGYHPRFHKNPHDINNIDGYYVFQVQAIRPAKVQPLSQVQAHLKQELPHQLQQQALVSFIRAWRARLRPITDCLPGYVIRKCRQYKSVSKEEPEDAYTVN